MKILTYPKNELWPEISKRPEKDKSLLDELISQIFSDVKKSKEIALKGYAEKFDGFVPDCFKVSEKEFEMAESQLSKDLKKAIQLAKNNIEHFHKVQINQSLIVETMQGVTCWQNKTPIEKVGLYIPGGTAPLFSSLLMLGIPATIAGCKQITICTPPMPSGEIHPAILYIAKSLGINQVFKIGGAQAIAALAFGTETISKAYKIFGPGNQFVTRAKELVQLQGVAIDMPAGPSEVLIIADKSCEADFVAADILSQAEHGADSQVVLLSDNKDILISCLGKIKNQIQGLPRRNIAVKALNNSKVILFKNVEECISFSNLYAPEHLILAINKAEQWAKQIKNAGSVFLGNYSCESAGDYASGTNHTLPTSGFARVYGGVTLDSFYKSISFQQINKKGIQNIGPAIEVMADAENLTAHKNAVSIRLKSLRNDQS